MNSYFSISLPLRTIGRTMIDVVRRTAEQCFMPLTVGGGIRTAADVREMLLAGADKVSINTAAIREPELIITICRGIWCSVYRRRD